MEIIRGRYNVRQASSKRRGLKWLWLLLPLLLIFSSSGYTYAAFQKPLPAPRLAANTLEAKPAEVVSLAWPAAAQAAVGSLEDGVLASSSQAEQAKPIASMTKVVTALAVLKKTPLKPGESGPSYKFEQADIDSYASYISRQGSVVPVNLGQSITQRQALEALLIVSANNIADSLVRWNFGSMEDFLVYANGLLKEYGLDKTTLTDASGFSPASVSTPSDMIILGQKLLSEPVLAEIVGLKRIDWPGWGNINNTNPLISDADVVGIKTGTTDEAGRCLLFALKHQIDAAHSTTIIGVIMGEPSYAALVNDARGLAASTRKGFGAVEVLPANSQIGMLTTEWNQSVQIVTAESLTVYGWKGKSYLAEVSLTEAKTIPESGLDVGDISLEGSKKSVDAVTDAAVTPPDSLWRLTNYF